MRDSSSPDPAGGEPGNLPEEGDDALAFQPVPLRYRHDGWTPDRQLDFIQALADCGCVDEAARAVGMNRSSAYALRRRHDALAFRLAWEAASDYSVARLGDAAMSRAINGVPVPIFHNGEQVGERRHFDERLTMFLLRYRDPVRYGRWLDRRDARQHQDGRTGILFLRMARMVRAAWRAFEAAVRGVPAPPPEPEHLDNGRDDGEER